MALEIEDHFPGDHLEELDENLDLGNEVTEDADEDADDDAQPADETAGDGADTDDADADAGDDAAGGPGEEPGDADADGDGDDDAEQPEPAPVKPEKSPVIPKARLDQELRKRRAAEQRAQELADELTRIKQEQAEASRPKPLSGEEIKAKMAEANEALIGGDTARAAELQAELFAALAAPTQAQVAAPVERDLVGEVEARLEFKQTLEEINTRFPQLDENSESFDEELSQEAVDLQRSYMNRGFTLAEATRKAAESVAKLHDLADTKAPAAPAVDPKAVAAQARQKQKTQDKIAKAVAAPPALTGRVDDGKDVAFDVFKASEDELMALPKATLDRLLGNSL